jgi:hypothetical protein
VDKSFVTETVSWAIRGPPKVEVPDVTAKVFPDATITLSFKLETPAIVSAPPPTMFLETDKLSCSCATPETVSGPPKVTEPDVTVKDLVSVIKTLSFNVETPETVKLFPTLIQPVFTSKFPVVISAFFATTKLPPTVSSKVVVTFLLTMTLFATETFPATVKLPESDSSPAVIDVKADPPVTDSAPPTPKFLVTEALPDVA